MTQLILVVPLLVGPAAPAQLDSTRLERQLHSTVREYSLSAETLLQALHRLATDFKLPMGVEWTRDAATVQNVTLSWREATVLNVIKDVLAEYPDYGISTSDGILHVFRRGLRDERDVSGVRLGPFAVTNQELSFASGWSLTSRVSRVLRPMPAVPNEGEAGSIGSGPGGDRKITFNASNPTLRDVLDGFALSAGQMIWAVTYRPEQEQARARFRTTVTSDGKPVAKDRQPVWVFIPWGRENLIR